MSRAEDIQKEYYKKTATNYDKMHVDDLDEHGVALRWMISICKSHSVKKILDVGCGTGRALFKLKAAGFHVNGVEPVDALVAQAIEKGAAPEEIVLARGENIPFPDGSFEATCEFGVLHHVEKPELILSEMMRISSKIIFISDANRFGQGPYVVRWAKLILFKLGLWPLVNWIRTRGKNYMISEGDGLFYSYSVYDSLATLNQWSKKIYLIPTRDEEAKSWLHPLLTSSHILLVAIKK